MKLPWFLFSLLLGLCTVGIVVSLMTEYSVVEVVDGEEVTTVKGHGFTHPDFATLNRGGPGAERHSKILWLGWFFGILQISLFVYFLGLGASKKGRLGPFKVPLAIGLACYAIVWTLMFISYQGYMTDETPALFGSLPKPTAIMFYGVWPVPIFFMFLYIYQFDRWIFTPEDAEKFKKLVEERRAREKDAS